ncbi:nitroreductase family protein [Croceibacter atlanticus]|uniref:nitroreductase family protein n=1 Tax=Croceibacter atlanticus TaxID=313588 RepID=UPI0024B88C6D|nr:nitroreductase [Croceibacter atlanticus]
MLFNIIKNRRSVFPQQYNTKPITRDTILQVLEAANWAPTHKKTEPWRFKIFQDDAKLRLGDFLASTYLKEIEKPSEFKAKKISQKFKSSHTVIAICMQRDLNERVPEWEEVAATAMGVQNMWLMCTELGIGCYWSSPSLIKHTNDFLNLEKGEACLGFLYMGYYDEPIEKGYREPIENKVKWFSK